MGASLVLVLLL
jgi:hypothetical protein